MLNYTLVDDFTYLYAQPQGGVGGMLHSSDSALEVGEMMMLRCHHSDLGGMHCHCVNIPPVEPSPAN